MPFAEGQYGGACSVMIPSRSTSTWRARSEVKIFPRSWKTVAGLPKIGHSCRHPAASTRRSFGSRAMFHQAHVVLFCQGSQSDHGPHDRGRFEHTSTAAWMRLVTGRPSRVVTYSSILCSSTWASRAGAGIESTKEVGDCRDRSRPLSSPRAWRTFGSSLSVWMYFLTWS